MTPAVESPWVTLAKLIADYSKKSVKVVPTKTVSLLEKYEFKETASYLKTASHHFYQGTLDTKYSDCISNCRKAFESLIKSITQKTKISEGISDLKGMKLIGKTEVALLKKLSPQLSKKGAHPPLANKSEAEFSLQLTEICIKMIIEKYDEFSETFKLTMDAFTKSLAEYFKNIK